MRNRRPYTKSDRDIDGNSHVSACNGKEGVKARETVRKRERPRVNIDKEIGVRKLAINHERQEARIQIYAKSS